MEIFSATPSDIYMRDDTAWWPPETGVFMDVSSSVEMFLRFRKIHYVVMNHINIHEHRYFFMT